MRRALRSTAALAASLVALAAVAPAQSRKDDGCWVCGNDPELMARAGLVNHGPFVFFESDSRELTDHLGLMKVVWLESEHFRIGLDLKPWRIPVSEKKAYRAELAELAETFPAIVPRKVSTLDRWLRIHLYAHRLEKLYRDLQETFGVSEEQFSLLPPEETFLGAVEKGWQSVLEADYLERPPRPQGWPQWLGMGRYMGMPMKYEVLMLQYGADMERLKRDYIGRQDPHPQRWHVTWRVDVGEPKSRCMWFGVAAESEKIRHDQHMHNAVIHNVSINVLDGFMLYLVESPVWLRVGLAHWFTQRNDPRFNFYDLDEGAAEMDRDESNWPVAVRKLVTKGEAPSFLDLARKRSFGQLTLEDHLASWSKVDFLHRTRPEEFARFLFLVKTRADFSANLDAQRDQIREAFGWSLPQVEAAWQEWVLATYPVK